MVIHFLIDFSKAAKNTSCIDDLRHFTVDDNLDMFIIYKYCISTLPRSQRLWIAFILVEIPIDTVRTIVRS